MASSRRCGISGCGWLLIVTAVFAAGVAVLAWLVRLERVGGGATVWITDAGTRYHHRDCASLARSHPHEISLEDAHQQGLAPCDLCHPPA
ncbi:MAG: hypothetical protein ACOCX2_04070 [Armatimonadota bacterium]